MPLQLVVRLWPVAHRGTGTTPARRSTRIAMPTLASLLLALASLLLTSVSAPVASASPLAFSQQGFQPQSLTNQAPALVSYDNKLYAAWKGKATDKVFYSEYGVGNCPLLPGGAPRLTPCWSQQAFVAGPWGTAHTPEAPALVAYDGDLYAFWTGQDIPAHVYYSSYNATSWSEPQTVEWSGAVNASTQGPSVTVSDGHLDVAWVEGPVLGPGGSLFFAQFDGSSWAGEPFTGSYIGSAAALVSYAGELYAFYTARSGNTVSFMTYNGDNKWSTPETVTGSWGSALTNQAPAVAVYDGDLYLAWKGESTHEIWDSDYNGSSWASQQVVPQALTNQGPALTTIGDDLYFAWKGKANDKVGFLDAA
jgi:hypothetical protein